MGTAVASAGTKHYDTLSSETATLEQATPMIRQFLEVKQQYPNTLLFYRMGDFYETFLEDALTAARALEITLTGRDAGGLGKIPMAGVPCKAVDTYLNRLLAMNYKVAICEQMEDPAEAKGLVERRVVRVLSSGTVTESTQVQAEKANYLAAIWLPSEKEGHLPAKAHQATGCAIAYVDVTTGTFCTAELSYAQLLSELDRLQPAEVLVPGKRRRGLGGLGVSEWVPAVSESIEQGYPCTPVANEAYDATTANVTLCRLFQVEQLDGFGLAQDSLALRACGAIGRYLQETFLDQVPPLDGIRVLNLTRHVMLTAGTRKNLELLATAREGDRQGSLFGVLNETVTAMGARLLREWISNPLTNLPAINERLDTVNWLLESAELRQRLRQVLPHIYDLERLSNRLAGGTILPRELLALGQSLEPLPMLSSWLREEQLPSMTLLGALLNLPPSVEQTSKLVRAAIKESPAVGLKEGGLIQAGYNEELDRFHALLSDQEGWLKRFEQEERERSGLKTLKVGYSRAFGYFIEISKAAASQAPEAYTRKQTLTNAERFITPELKRFETEVLEAQSRTMELEYELFCQLRLELKPLATELKQVAQAVARLDALQSLAEVAERYDYVRPQLNLSTQFHLVDARHPVVERQRAVGSFVANDCAMAGVDTELESGLNNDPQVLVITGPNMAGKSTYMRQVAIIALMAQMGSFVPAREATLGIVDAVYTRIGAVDDLSAGQSTFMVEMAETAQILNGATARSLVILDEVGRGTSTYDGLAIAWSVLDYIVQRLGCRTLFATHYHELNVLQLLYPQRVLNVRVCVSEQGHSITFLHKVEPGSAQKSYGIQVAKMAGLPAEVLQLADKKLADLQKEAERYAKQQRGNLVNRDPNDVQLSLL